MKKEYVKPSVEIVEIESQCILEGSMCPPDIEQGGSGTDGGCAGNTCDD